MAEKIRELVINDNRIEGEEHLRAGIKQFWEDIGGRKHSSDEGGERFVLGGRSRVGMEWQEIHLQEVICALKKLKDNKAVGMNGISYDFINIGGEVSLQAVSLIILNKYGERGKPQKTGQRAGSH